MKIKNESQRMFCFNGGFIKPGEVVDIQDRKVAEALVRGYPGELFCLETADVKVIPAVEEKTVVDEPVDDEPARVAVKAVRVGRKAKSKK